LPLFCLRLHVLPERQDRHSPTKCCLGAPRGAHVDVIHQHTRLKPNLRKVHFNALFMLQASPARVNVTNYVLDLITVSRSILVPLGLDGAHISANKRVQDVCAKSNVCFIAEEAEPLKGAVGNKCKKAAYLCQVEVMAPTFNECAHKQELHRLASKAA